MKALIIFLIAFNGCVEAARVYDISYYKVKEIKLKKLDKQAITKLTIINRGAL